MSDLPSTPQKLCTLHCTSYLTPLKIGKESAEFLILTQDVHSLQFQYIFLAIFKPLLFRLKVREAFNPYSVVELTAGDVGEVSLQFDYDPNNNDQDHYYYGNKNNLIY